MRLVAPPRGASWTHVGARTGFEAAFFSEVRGGHRLTGNTTAHESSALWSVAYDVVVDNSWTTVEVHASNLTAAGSRELALARDATGTWTANSEPRPELHGCVDVDFESSAMTNTLPLHRLEFVEGGGVDVPAAFVRADDLRVERLEQRYTLITTTPEWLVFHYASSTFDFECELRYDRAGLVIEYPGIAVRQT